MNTLMHKNVQHFRETLVFHLGVYSREFIFRKKSIIKHTLFLNDDRHNELANGFIGKRFQMSLSHNN